MGTEKSMVALQDETLPVTVAVAPKAKNPRTHPRYIEMVTDAIVTLKERNGSSHYAIAKHIQEKHKQLPSNFKKLLSVQLKKFVATEKLVKVKNSFKLPSGGARLKGSKSAVATVPTKKSAKPVKKIVSTTNSNVTTKPAAKPKVKPGSKSVPTNAKPNSKAELVAKPKAAKPKVAEAKPKAKATDKPAKAAKTSTKTSPGKAAEAAKTSTKTSPGKVVRKPDVTIAIKIKKLKEIKTPPKKAVN